MIAAQQYFIEYGTDMAMERLFTLLPNFIPDYCLTGVEKAMDRWAALVLQAYKKSYYLKEKIPALKVKEDIVSYAKYKWPLLFSRFYEAYRYIYTTQAIWLALFHRPLAESSSAKICLLRQQKFGTEFAEE